MSLADSMPHMGLAFATGVCIRLPTYISAASAYCKYGNTPRGVLRSQHLDIPPSWPSLDFHRDPPPPARVGGLDQLDRHAGLLRLPLLEALPNRARAKDLLLLALRERWESVSDRERERERETESEKYGI